MMPAPTLDGRLLCASSAAYAITGDMTTLAPDPKDVYISGAGFVQPPSVYTAGLDGIDGCLVGQIQDGLTLAFRGMMPFDLENPPSVQDWVTDFNAVPISVTGFPGAVHAGFSGALTALWPDITAELQRQSAGALRVDRSRSPGIDDLFTDMERFDYQPVGALQYIEGNGQIVDDSPQLRAQRDQTLAVEIPADNSRRSR